MKHLIKYSFLLIVIFNNSYAQKITFEQKITQFITQSKDIEEVAIIFRILKEHNKSIEAYKLYIPTIPPVNPKKTRRLSSLFGKRFHPIDGKVKKHLGLDFSATYGVPIHASASGYITKAKKSKTGYGNQVYILHGFGFKTRYAHLEKIYVKQGQKVKKGDIIGFVGSTGKSTGSHLHYEVIKNKKHLNPQGFCFIQL